MRTHRRGGRSPLALLIALLVGLAIAVPPVVSADDGASPSPEPTPSTTAEPSAEPAPPASAEPSPSTEPTPSGDASPSAEPTSTAAPSAEPTGTADPTQSADPTPAPTLPPFSMNLYRTAGYVRQYNGAWCTAAATQMMSNFGRLSVSASAWIDRGYVRQYTIIRYAKQRDTLARSSGTDPAGWAAALRRYGGSSAYAWRMFLDYDDALRSAVERLRATGKPVGLLAWNGRHAWILHGFYATADPALTDDYTITGLRVTGSLAGTDPRNGWISPAYLKVRWGRYYERDGYLGWVGKYVLIAA